ncbi:dethiobiotin synthase [Halorubellus sp. PRR65]|uniref:dethiobiotin synthase n=1 Tax=Halorubellus sp. PRR65 TaxID=3098148 RepID=UPI002B258207|nr:dethiobiotin synthase [Halorubellus sp. PRR65]
MPTDTTTTTLAVVGTGTGVGKTVVTAGLTGRLRDAGVDALAVKPCQSGHPPDDDAAFVRAACEDPDAAVCPQYLEPALAPRVAAERDDVDLSYETVRDDAASALAGAGDVGLLEGIGGLRVPLAGDREVVDLVADLADAAVVVARSGLGTLNHSALTVDALRAVDVPVTGVVLNDHADDTVAERTNPRELERMTGVAVHTLPHLAVDDDPTAAVAGVREHLDANVYPQDGSFSN